MNQLSSRTSPCLPAFFNLPPFSHTYFYYPDKETAMGSIVVSLSCTAHLWGACLRYKLKIQMPGMVNFGFKIVICLCLQAIFTSPATSQDTLTIRYKKHVTSAVNASSMFADTSMPQQKYKPYPAIRPTSNGYVPLTQKQVKSRVRLVAIANVVGYSSILAGLNADWYSNYPRSKFHTFNDIPEWLQVDKAGHMYGAYIESRLSMELWRWTGISQKKRIWYGGLSGVLYQAIIETLDGFSSGWGWSWGDIGANVAGSTTMIAQELAWNDQRIKLKFSFHKNDYGEPALNLRADKVYGKTLAERFIKDYNATTFWASANMKSFLPQSNLPPWLSVAVGYGAEGMFGARDNTAKDVNGNTTFDRRDIKRYRQWYLAPDIDFTKIKTNKKAMRFLFTVLTAFKFPAPSLEFSNGKFKVNAVTF